MTSPAPRHRYTFREYLDLEEVARVRHEFYQGEIYAMAGGTPEHAAMAAAITAILGRQLDAKSCRVYSSDLRVRVLATGLATYPDVTVICGPSERDPNSPTHVTNPKLVVEVLSTSTADYDRGEKVQHYQQIPSLAAILLVDHESERIDLWTRSAGVWQARSFGTGEIVPLDTLGAALPVDEVYAAARQA
jgi:Uma2 family endonuclease